MERLLRSSERLIHLVNDLLGISRIQMGKIELEMGEVDLCEIVKSVVEEFGMAAEEKGIGLHASCPTDGVPVVAGDKQKLRDCVLNLVDNAIRYTEKGSVDVSVRREINDLVVRVEDTGPGLDAEEARKLFESFQRGRSAGSTGRKARAWASTSPRSSSRCTVERSGRRVPGRASEAPSSSAFPSMGRSWPPSAQARKARNGRTTAHVTKRNPRERVIRSEDSCDELWTGASLHDIPTNQGLLPK